MNSQFYNKIADWSNHKKQLNSLLHKLCKCKIFPINTTMWFLHWENFKQCMFIFKHGKGNGPIFTSLHIYLFEGKLG